MEIEKLKVMRLEETRLNKIGVLNILKDKLIELIETMRKIDVCTKIRSKNNHMRT